MTQVDSINKYSRVFLNFEAFLPSNPYNLFIFSAVHLSSVPQKLFDSVDQNTLEPSSEKLEKLECQSYLKFENIKQNFTNVFIQNNASSVIFR